MELVNTSITANAGTNLNTSALALESGGNLANIVTNTTGLATASAQTTGNSSLSTIATNTTGLATSANLTSGTQQTKITNGTNISDVVAGDSGFNGLATASATKTYTFTTSSSGAQTILANTPTEGYSWIEVVYTSVGSGLALTGQFSTTSGGTYVNSSTFASGNGVGNVALGVTVNTIYNGAIRGNFFQIAVSALTSGTFTGTVTLRAAPIGYSSTNIAGSVSQSGTWTVQPGNTPNTTPWLVSQIATTPTTSNVASSATNVTLLSSNASAKSRSVFNESTQVMYLKYGSTASVTSYTVQIGANTYFEFPQPTYTGQVDALWASANGSARITEVT